MDKSPFPISVSGSHGLLLVDADASVDNSLRDASEALESAIAIVEGVVEGLDAKSQATLYGALTLIEIGKGLTDAALVKYGLAKDAEVGHD
ncbi:hypothetical protein BLA6993_05503 [Burkholderia lata]|uniref:hypothetical protein n=1 Tax=Burkholderia lata (strain ATCC 17760 / DSM 23089 / LMG 22485 / NCIMB 9086 / R18194 / 383) TaxID=482957 RepID=UPI00145316D6|nr:hypothetical protein [Burkholderia lata]VWC14211.1 hypothetical protein BLA6993_05503 [Burkholderia lata]